MPINVHQEALDFMLDNNICPTDVTCATVEKAISLGFFLGTSLALEMVNQKLAETKRPDEDWRTEAKARLPYVVQ